jgi:hypothetical protein
VAIFSRVTTSCPATAKDGSKLDNSFTDSTVNGVFFAALCTYFGGAECAYFADVSSIGTAQSAWKFNQYVRNS